MKSSNKSDHCEGSEEFQEVIVDSLSNIESQPIPAKNNPKLAYLQ